MTLAGIPLARAAAASSTEYSVQSPLRVRRASRAVAIRLFCALPLLFVYATLRDLTRRPAALARREVVKISRREVKSLTILSFLGVMSNRALGALVERTRTRVATV